MSIDYNAIGPIGWTDPRMEYPWRVIRSLMPACGESGLAFRPEHLTFAVHLTTFRIFAELIGLRLEVELRRPVAVEVHPDKAVFKFQEFA